MCLATAYEACLEELLMKMLFNILQMHHDRVTRFFSDLRTRKPFSSFHVQFILDAHGQHGATHYLVFHRKRNQIRWYTVGRRGRVAIGFTRANSLCEEGDTLCLQKNGCGTYVIVSDTETLHAARVRWAQLRTESENDSGIDAETWNNINALGTHGN